jgi:predicted ArsR family transcriptional regulator
MNRQAGAAAPEGGRPEEIARWQALAMLRAIQNETADAIVRCLASTRTRMTCDMIGAAIRTPRRTVQDHIGALHANGLVRRHELSTPWGGTEAFAYDIDPCGWRALARAAEEIAGPRA